MRINNNISAMNTYSRLTSAQGAQSKSLEKLSSGLRINRAGDDAAGLAISEKMRGQIKGLNQAVRNAQDGISLIQTAEGALNETHSILQRMRELAVQSANDTSTIDDRREIQKEMNELIDEVDRIADNTQFNTQTLLDGSFSSKKFHIGSNENQDITLSVASMNTAQIGAKSSFDGTNAVADIAALDFGTTSATVTVGNTVLTLDTDYSNNMEDLVKDLNNAFVKSEGVTFSSQGSNLNYTSSSDFDIAFSGAALGTAQDPAGTTGTTIADLKITSGTATTGGVLDNSSSNTAIESIDKAIMTVSSERSKLGATQNRLDHTINNLSTTSENLSAAESRIRDVDMAKEMMEFTKNNILNQASTAMLAQANQMPQGVLQLLG